MAEFWSFDLRIPMRHIIDAGTDVATLVVFDPAALPKDFDSMDDMNKLELTERLHDEHKLFRLATESDGGYSFHVYVDQPVDEYLLKFLDKPQEVQPIDVPSGRVFFAGAEYAFKSDDSKLRKCPAMGGSITLPAGGYRLTAQWTNYTSKELMKLVEKEARSKIEPFWLWFSRNMWGCCVLGFIGMIIGALVIGSFVPNDSWVHGLWAPLLIAYYVLLFVLSRFKKYRTARQSWKEFMAEAGKKYPSLVVQLKANGKT